jgi:NADH-quinone oxidoreductase subunit L
MVASSAVAFVGVGFAAFVWLRRRGVADAAARGLAPVHRTLLNKYYVDEAYDAVIVRPLHVLSRNGLWRLDDAVVDGAVNGTASIVASLAVTLRRLQTGSVRAYAGSLLGGVVLILGYYFWR